jgi:hypothetical protein
MFNIALPSSWLAFVIALVVTQVLGFLWYSNVLFAKPWMKAIGKTEKQIQAQSNPTVYIYSVVGAGIMLLILSNVLRWAGIVDPLPAVGVALAIWLGFVATSSTMNTAFENRGWPLWAIDNGYHVVNAVLSALILTLIK